MFVSLFLFFKVHILFNFCSSVCFCSVSLLLYISCQYTSGLLVYCCFVSLLLSVYSYRYVLFSRLTLVLSVCFCQFSIVILVYSVQFCLFTHPTLSVYTCLFTPVISILSAYFCLFQGRTQTSSEGGEGAGV